MLPGLASVITAAIWSPNSVEGLLDRVDVVVRQHDRVGGGRTGDPRRGRQAQRRDAGAGVGEQRVDMAVVAAGELDDLGAAGESAGQPDRAHRGLGAGVDQPDQLDRRHPVDDLGGQFAFGGSRRPERQASGGGLGDGLHDRRVRVAEDHRPPRADQVDVAVAVGVGQPVARPRVMKRGVPPTALNARTGELTPPGMTAQASSNSFADRSVLHMAYSVPADPGAQ